MRIVHYNTDKKKVQNARKERRKEREKLGGMYVMRKNLKEARRKAGMTQQQMAERLDIGLRHYKKLESGETLGRLKEGGTYAEIYGD